MRESKASDPDMQITTDQSKARRFAQLAISVFMRRLSGPACRAGAPLQTLGSSSEMLVTAQAVSAVW